MRTASLCALALLVSAPTFAAADVALSHRARAALLLERCACEHAQANAADDSDPQVSELRRRRRRKATYQEMRAQAIREHRPLIVWIGVKQRKVPGALHYECDSFDGYAQGSKGIVVGWPTGEDMTRVDLHHEATDEEILGSRPPSPPRPILD